MTSSRIGSPLRVTNKNFQFQTRDNSFIANDKVIDPSVLGHLRSASTGNGMNQNNPSNQDIQAIRRKSNTARDGKMMSSSTKVSITQGRIPEKGKNMSIHIDHLKSVGNTENVIGNLSSTRYNVVANYELSKNKNFYVKEELSKVHIQQTINYPKSYYVSALEKVRKSKKDGATPIPEDVIHYRLSK